MCPFKALLSFCFLVQLFLLCTNSSGQPASQHFLLPYPNSDKVLRRTQLQPSCLLFSSTEILPSRASTALRKTPVLPFCLHRKEDPYEASYPMQDSSLHFPLILAMSNLELAYVCTGVPAGCPDIGASCLLCPVFLQSPVGTAGLTVMSPAACAFPAESLSGISLLMLWTLPSGPSLELKVSSKVHCAPIQKEWLPWKCFLDPVF